jgi:heat shock protein HslJ
MPGSQEDLFFKALELTRKARLEGDQLVLLDDAGKVLARFLKAN